MTSFAVVSQCGCTHQLHQQFVTKCTGVHSRINSYLKICLCNCKRSQYMMTVFVNMPFYNKKVYTKKSKYSSKRVLYFHKVEGLARDRFKKEGSVSMQQPLRYILFSSIVQAPPCLILQFPQCNLIVSFIRPSMPAVCNTCFLLNFCSKLTFSCKISGLPL